MGQVSYFLGHKFQWKKYQDTDNIPQLKVHLSQKAFVDQLVHTAQLDSSINNPETPYRSGYPVNSVPEPNPQEPPNQELINHLDAARHAISYTKRTSPRGIAFDSSTRPILKSYNRFQIDPLQTLTDVNWGAQDQSVSSKPQTTPLFKSPSMSVHIIHLYGPLRWQSKRQTITVRSSAEAEIYATEECVRELTYIRKVFKDLNLIKTFMNKPVPILNDNMTCVQWCRNRTTRTIRHIQLRDNAVREGAQRKEIIVRHVPGSENIEDIFTKKRQRQKSLQRSS